MKIAKITFIALLLLWLATSTVALLAANWNAPIPRAVFGMVAGLIVLWIFLGGGLMVVLRQPIAAAVRRIPAAWPLKFILFATLLAMLEEAVTTGMTNLAPWFGVEMGQAYITASANYLDVVLRHSVIVFAPMFAAWAWLLNRWAFSPFQVFLLFGLTGLLAEALIFGAQNLLGFAQWIFVYGLMVYLPACSLPPDRQAVSPRWLHFPLAILIPLLAAMAAALLVGLLFPNHPAIHFPPLQS